MARLSVPTHAPDGYKAIMGLDGYLKENLDAELLDFVKLRASQINGCGFCVDLHSTDLEKMGVPTRKIYALSTWREAGFFTDRERAALALTEEVTLIPSGVDDTTWNHAAAVFSEKELSDLIIAIGTINLWNRIGVATHLAPPPLN
ncbi:MAG: carboxymuconolactone decarboxylase family protein [Candidatus Nanopelagicales bacterium]